VSTLALVGTIRERRPGVWQLRISAGFDPVDGRRRVITETFTGSKRAAAKRLAELQVETSRSRQELAGQTLKATIAAWRADTVHASGTDRNYDLAVKSIPAHLMRTPIDKIRAATLNELYRRVVDQHGIHRTRLVHAVISGALTHAWRHEWIVTNVARRVKPPSLPRRRSAAPTGAEVRRLLELVEDSPEIYAWLLMSAMVGGRRSEILALRWSDIDLDVGQLSISKALDPVGGGMKTTKTDGDRTVAIGPELVAALRRWRVAFLERAMATGTKPVADPFVFTGAWDGSQPWRPDVATKRFAQLRDTAGVHCRLHDLRHYVATRLLAGGVPAKVVADRLGHTRIATTTDLYGHTIPASDRASAEMLERGLSS
jgi:integrase